MRRFSGVLILVAVAVVGFGFYRGWFALSSPGSNNGSDQVNVNLATDTGKIKEDAAKVADKAAELTGSATQRPAESGDRPAADAPSTEASPDNGPSKAVETSAAQSRGN